MHGIFIQFVPWSSGLYTLTSTIMNSITPSLSSTRYEASEYGTWNEFRFTTDDLSNTSVIDEEDTVVFSSSSQGKNPKSDVTYTGPSGTPVAHIEPRRLRSDKLTFIVDGKETTTSISEWLTQSKGWEPGQAGEGVFFVGLKISEIM